MTERTEPNPMTLVPSSGQALNHAEQQPCAVRLNELHRPTPCAEFDVGGVLDHMTTVPTRQQGGNNG